MAKTINYRGYIISLDLYRNEDDQWVSSATVIKNGKTLGPGGPSLVEIDASPAAAEEVVTRTAKELVDADINAPGA